MSPPAEAQERWQQVYQAAEERGGERVLVGAMLQRLDKRRIWSTVLMITSTMFLVGMTTVFYNVLSQ